eukprot:CAMPEP_0185017702 /NCGR_PEP_ID=MMETSP1103-20130426/620_1 /TAXON_ID=36769 /ORGANISM="Paraphysomonas bandaiensis, Strain Caron Lab Isolate" /LENGTH=76 /DNA_ID=CAMNT_0027547245 /DNA_START=60 /DNA_END=290 /DNA_ORIENTATION=+
MSLTGKYIAQNAQAYWRQSNLNYLQYVNVSSKVLRRVLKEPARSKALAREGVLYNKSLSGGDKIPVTSVFAKARTG